MLFFSAASSREWGPEEILNSENYEADEKEIEKANVNGVIFLPSLMGERSPHNDVTAKGAFIGLSVTTSGERSKAAMEKSGFCAERLSESRARGQSGTEKYETLRRGKEQSMGRILSEMRSLPVQNLETEQGPAFGKRILAMAGCGEYETLEEAAGRIVRVKEAIEPNAGTGARV